MPNIAFHKPQKHARKSTMYSCKRKKICFIRIQHVNVFLKSHCSRLRFPVISLRRFMGCELWCSIGPIAYSPFHLFERHYMRTKITKPNKIPQSKYIHIFSFWICILIFKHGLLWGTSEHRHRIISRLFKLDTQYSI